MKLLALDSSTEACSAAIYCDGMTLSRYQLAPRKHAELLLPMFDELLAEAALSVNQLDAVAFGRGPGAFTGLRIAAGVVQGLAFAADLPVVPVSTLATLAQGVWRETGRCNVLAGLDARLEEVYWGAYSLDPQDIMRAVVSETVCSPHKIPLPDGDGWYGAGSAWDVYNDILSDRLDGCCHDWQQKYFPHAEDIITLALVEFKAGNSVSAEQAVPVYLRDNVASRSTRNTRPGSLQT